MGQVCCPRVWHFAKWDGHFAQYTASMGTVTTRLCGLASALARTWCCGEGATGPRSTSVEWTLRISQLYLWRNVAAQPVCCSALHVSVKLYVGGYALAHLGCYLLLMEVTFVSAAVLVFGSQRARNSDVTVPLRHLARHDEDTLRCWFFFRVMVSGF